MVPPVVLASTSRHRRMLMDRLGIAYERAAPRCGESLAEGTGPREGVLELSVRKARSVAGEHPSAVVIGSDQMAVVGGEVLSKPGSEERAVEQLLGLAGRTHELWTGLCALDVRDGRELVHVEVWRMTLRPLGRRQLERYVRADAPLDCAGGYRFESLGVALFESVSGGDPTAIAGLPLIALTAMLARMGVDVP